VRYETIQVGVEYALKHDMQQRGKLPLAVCRVKVLAKDVPIEVERWGDRYSYHNTSEKKANGIAVEVVEVLYDPRWTSRGFGIEGEKNKGKVRIGRGPTKNRQWTGIGETAIVEGGHDFVAPWDEYWPQRAALDQQKNDAEAAEWERAERQKIIAERLDALGFTTREHGSPWRRKGGYTEYADYTREGNRITLDALDRLLVMAEASGMTAPPPDPRVQRLDRGGE
jgi:hypothetical protein